jgi:predicted HicB family RNase H-like nuclease
MNESKTSISQATSYQEIGEYWDTHDLAEIWEQTEPAEFEVDIQSEQVYYRLDRELSSRVVTLAHNRGISAETLLNLWIQEKLSQAFHPG